MKRISVIFLLVSALFISCSTSEHLILTTDTNLTGHHFVPTSSNFKNLGTFIGTCREHMKPNLMEGEEGLIARARLNLMDNIAKAGINMSDGSKYLDNIVVEEVKFDKVVVVTISAEVIEYK